MIFGRKIMTSYAGSHNLIAECHNMVIENNFFRREETSSLFKISNKKAKLQALNTHQKATATWPNEIG